MVSRQVPRTGMTALLDRDTNVISSTPGKGHGQGICLKPAQTCNALEQILRRRRAEAREFLWSGAVAIS